MVFEKIRQIGEDHRGIYDHKVQRINTVTYLFEKYRGKSIAASYEHELHRATHRDVYLVEEVLRRKGDKMYIKWDSINRTFHGYIKNNII